MLNWLLVMGLAMLAGLAAWWIGESTYTYFKVSPFALEKVSQRDPGPMNQEMPGVSARNGALTFGTMGGLLGLGLGLAGGLAGRSAGRAALGGFAGLILGTAAGALPSLFLMPWHWHHRNDDPATLELLGPLLVHLGLWSAAGLAAGLAFGIGARGSRPARLIEAAFAGLVGAMVGTFVFEIAGAYLFPSAHTPDPFSDTPGTRLLARLCVAGFVGLGAIRALPAEAGRDAKSKLSEFA
jgi:hypothetical protein